MNKCKKAHANVHSCVWAWALSTRLDAQGLGRVCLFFKVSGHWQVLSVSFLAQGTVTVECVVCVCVLVGRPRVD